MLGILIRLVIVAGLIGGILVWYNTPEQEQTVHEGENATAREQASDKAVEAAEETSQETSEEEKSSGSSFFAFLKRDEATTTENELADNPEDLPIVSTKKVPHVVQAPEAQWEDVQYQDACEEASLFMAHLWLTGQKAPKKADASAELKKVFQFVQEKFGQDVIDTSAEDTARIFREFYGHDAEVRSNMPLDDMFRELAVGNLIIVPTDGKALHNPYFSGDGPERHMVVITGYDNRKGLFFTNDPGTKRGKNYAYKMSTLYNAIRDYPTGNKVPIESSAKRMIIVRQ